MTTLGFCTHFSKTDKLAFDLAFRTVKMNQWQLTICHWLKSPYHLRRDIVRDDLFEPHDLSSITPKLLIKLEMQLRSYYDTMLEDFTNVAFKLCEGQYQVELARCFHNHLLDLVVMGYPSETSDDEESEGIEEFASHLNHPIILVGHDGPDSYLINPSALAWVDKLQLKEGSYTLIEPSLVH